MPIKFCSEDYFSGLRFFNEPEISDSGTQSLQEDLCSEFLRPEKIHRPQPWFEPANLDLEVSALPRDHRGGLKQNIMRQKLFILCFTITQQTEN